VFFVIASERWGAIISSRILMKAINLGHVFEKYKGMWVTLTESLDTVVNDGYQL